MPRWLCIRSSGSSNWRCSSWIARAMKRRRGPMPEPAQPLLPVQRQINALQYCRAIAALAVLFAHAMLATAAFVEPPPGFLQALAMNGFLGVDFFFVLSGFIIMHAHMDDPRAATAALRYVVKRLRRIYVPYLPIGVGLIVLYLLFPTISRGTRDWGLLTSLTLFPTSHPLRWW